MPPGDNKDNGEAMRDADGPSNRARCGLTRSRSATLLPTKSDPTGETANETVRRQTASTSRLRSEAVVKSPAALHRRPRCISHVYMRVKHMLVRTTPDYLWLPSPFGRRPPPVSMYAAEERDSQPAQRDELAHSRIVPTRGGVLPPANDPSPTAITENTGSQQ